jgi:hypothetical protein
MCDKNITCDETATVVFLDQERAKLKNVTFPLKYISYRRDVSM